MELIRHYFPQLSDSQQQRFSMMKEVYSEWNEKINVVSRKDIEALEVHHILHSLAIARVISFKPGTRVMDVGTGGGFPGIPLAVLFPEVDFYLVDSIGKKIHVVNEVVRELGLKNVKAQQLRVEMVDKRFDFIVSRAVTAFPDFVKLVRGKIDGKGINALPNGILYLKGGDFNEEVKAFRKQLLVYPVSTFFSEPYFETKKVIYLPLEG